MDATANLAEQRRLTAKIMAIWDNCADDGEFSAKQLDELAHNAYRLAELSQALDEWMARGGHKPAQWQ